MFLLGSGGIFRIPKWLEHNLPPLIPQRLIAIQTNKSNMYHSNKREPPPFFHWYTNTWPRFDPFFWQSPCSGCNSGTDLVVVLEYVFFQLCSKPNEALRFTRFRRSYVNYTAVVLTNNCQSYTIYLLDVCCSKWQSSLFCSCLSPMIVHLRKLFLLSTLVARMLSTP